MCIRDRDYIRLQARSERQRIQKKLFALPELPTTTIGSFPQTKDVKANRSAFRKGEITKQEYEEFNKRKIAECVKWQEEIGLDVLVHEMCIRDRYTGHTCSIINLIR